MLAINCPTGADGDNIAPTTILEYPDVQAVCLKTSADVEVMIVVVGRASIASDDVHSAILSSLDRQRLIVCVMLPNFVSNTVHGDSIICSSERGRGDKNVAHW